MHRFIIAGLMHLSFKGIGECCIMMEQKQYYGDKFWERKHEEITCMSININEMRVEE